MIFTPTRIPDVHLVDIARRQDTRGHFARLFCTEAFAAHGLATHFPQISMSFNATRGTMRGLHFQYPPTTEAKYVRCLHGEIFDVVVDLRPESPTYLEHVGVHLSAENGRGLYVPERFAHGFMTLRDDTEVLYLISAAHMPGLEGGLPHDDPALAIEWPGPVSVMSERDSLWQPVAQVGAEIAVRLSLRETVA
ncbi:dTDP-4-dehydrorhamnose 3,5-epimerase [uncultured Methylobacterium sp.]|jgi:dTDP-4-dehydrorhamnose 3,5-epimerase|uniref:dTDP-4-dehydrorhamnose 3,5-epimerase n=1 Tax=uncultured Methylobacterium sp. TaxID=157278 RepID=UPI002615C6BF|nr:dTDP-4-dehydrorhamnose 3,5-epimerase [uncultured Methylobacterium sp.]